MNELMITNNELTMSSLDIANLLGNRHSDTKRSIERLANRGAIQLPPMAKVEDNQSLSPNNKTSAYIFSGEKGKRDSIIVVAQLSPEFTAALVDRWQELESQNVLQLPNFNNPAEAARAWADQVEARIEAQKRIEELAPKAQFVDKYVQGDGLMKFRQVCKLLNAKENEFRAFLVDRKIMYRLNGTWVAHSNHLSIGRFESKTGVTAGGRAYSETLFTAKGVEWIAGEWAKYNVREVA